MRKILFLISSLAAIIFYSCEDTIEPYGELPDGYAINLILKGDDSLQTAYISRLYQPDDFGSINQEVDPAVGGVELSLQNMLTGKVYYFRDTVDNENFNPHYNSPAKYYYLADFWPEAGSWFNLSAKFPDETILTSTLTMPQTIIPDESETTRIIPGAFVDRDTVYVTAAWLNNNIKLVKARKVYFDYYIRQPTGEDIKYRKYLPVGDTPSASAIGSDIDISYSDRADVRRTFLNVALEEISEGNPVKGSYAIGPVTFEIMNFDEGLSEYYHADLFYNYGFTIRNNPSDFTNISGGKGFFGGYTYMKIEVPFQSNWLMDNFGYRFYEE